MKFCLELSHGPWAQGDFRSKTEQIFEQVRLADELGFDSLWLNEDPDGWDAFSLLSAFARVTTQLRLGTGVTNPFLRQPNLISASISTLDRLSEGRAFLGLGRGQPEWYRDSFDMDVSEPLRRVEQTIDLLRQWWRPPHRASSAAPMRVRDWQRTVSPAALPPGPPIYLAATGPNALELAGRATDGVRFNELASEAFLQQSIVRAKRAARDAGNDPTVLSFFVHPSISVTDDPERALERKKAKVALIYTLPGMERQLMTPGIDVANIMAEVRWHMKTDEALARGANFAEMKRIGDLEAAKRVIPMELMDRIAIAGPTNVVKRRLASLHSLGATHVFFRLEEHLQTPGGVESLISEIGAGASKQ